MENLFPHNQAAYEKVMAAFNSGQKKTCIVHATGTGKSYIIGAVSEHFEKVLIIAPMTFILDETRKLCGDRVTYTTYASLLYQIPEQKYDLIVLDEFHRAGAEMWSQKLSILFNRNPEARIFGTTATPVRGRDHNNLCDSLFEGNVASVLTLADAMKQEILAIPKAYICGSYSFDETFQNYSVRISDSNLSVEKKKELRAKLRNIQNSWTKADGVVNILKQYYDDTYHKRIIVFGATIEQLFNLMDQVKAWFVRAGVKRPIACYKIDSSIPEKEQSKIMQDYCTDEEGVLKIAFAVNMLNEGVHIPGVDCIMCLRSTMSPIIVFQQLGRCLSAGAKPPLILDLVSNLERLQANRNFLKRQASQENLFPIGSLGGRTNGQVIPFTIMASTKDTLKELDNLNHEIQGIRTDEDIFRITKALSCQYSNLKDVPPEYKPVIARYRKIFGVEKLHDLLPSSRQHHSKEECRQAALKYKTKSEWKHSKDGSSYNCAVRNKWIKELTEHMVLLRPTYTYEECLATAKPCKKFSEWSTLFPNLYTYAKKKNWTDQLLQDMNWTKRRLSTSYTKEECIQIAQQYTSTAELRKSQGSAWTAIKLNHWEEECYAHIDKRHKALPYPTKISKAECKEQAKAYYSRKSIKKLNFQLYNIIIKNHWEDDCFPPLRKPGGVSKECQGLLIALKKAN